MDEKLKAALTKRLIAYAASAGVTLALCPRADGQVVYCDFEPDRVTPDGAEGILWLDFDDDGVFDAQLDRWAFYRHVVGYGECPVQGFDGRGLGANGVLDGSKQGIRGVLGLPTRYYIYLARLSYGDTVGPTGYWAHEGVGVREYQPGAYYCFPYGYGNFYGSEGYAGFRFTGGDGQRHYGWMRLRGDYSGHATVYEYGYEASPETPITAGETSDALLTGTIAPTVFPAEGDTLDYTYEVENRTDAPISLDLWMEMGLDREHMYTFWLDTLTVPPAASLPGSAHVAIADSLDPGLYYVRFKLGSFPQRQFITLQRFQITKEGNPVAVEPDPDGVPATHALSAPRPNPSSGEVAFTLAVAEAQAVRVEVLDALGRRVAVLLDGAVEAGTEQRLTFDGAGLPSGVYVVRAVGETFADARVVSLAR